MTRNAFICFVTCMCMFASLNSFSAVRNFNAKVQRILTDDVLFGGCMALLDRSGTSATSGAIDCPQRWVAMDCDASILETSTKSKGANKLSAAQLAMITETWVTVYLTDTPKAEEAYCVAIRIDNFGPSQAP